jgi:hypothetical protein
LILHASGESFSLENQPAGVVLEIPTDKAALNAEVPAWHHFAFTYVAGRKRLQHYVDGVAQKAPKRVKLAALEAGDEAYLSVGRDGVWGRPLPGLLDELRFSSGLVYSADFQPPGTFSSTGAKAASGSSLASGPRLLFGGGVRSRGPVDLGSRKHLFIDDALVSVSSDVTFRVNPATRIEPVMENIQGPLRKHVTVIEDDDGLIRLYAGRHNNHLGVWISRDGVNWEAPDLGREDASGERNIVIHESVAVGSVFIDPNAPPQERWKYISGYHDRGVYLYVSSDGWSFKRYRTAVLPFRSGSQSITYYDDQRQRYVGFHRSDFGATPVGKTERSTVRTEVRDLTPPWPFEPVSPERYEEVGKTRRIKDFQPWYLDNGPLTPGGFGIEYPLGFGPEDSIDSPGTDIYVPKIVKYPWAPDVYLNFALVYFHYWGDGPETRQELGREERGRGSGPIETQLAVSRDGVHWQRYGRPAYIGVGRVGDYDIHQTYTADGMVRRGDEIWQYVYGQEEYHSRWIKTGTRDAFFRVVQRLDGFVSADTPYEREGVLITRPFTFTGNRLLLNIDTDAAGYAQVGFIGEDGRPVAGYSVDDCIYINGDYIENEVEWMKSGKDLSSLVGTRVSLVFRMRGCKLYAMQFADR